MESNEEAGEKRFWRVGNKTESELNSGLFEKGYPYIVDGTLCGYYDKDNECKNTDAIQQYAHRQEI